MAAHEHLWVDCSIYGSSSATIGVEQSIARTCDGLGSISGRVEWTVPRNLPDVMSRGVGEISEHERIQHRGQV